MKKENAGKSAIIYLAILSLLCSAISCFVTVGSIYENSYYYLSSNDYFIHHYQPDYENSDYYGYDVLRSGKVKAEGLKIKDDGDPAVTYKVHYYDKYEELLFSTDYMTGDYNGSDKPENAKYAKIEIKHDKDKEIENYEIERYVAQVIVKVKK